MVFTSGRTTSWLFCAPKAKSEGENYHALKIFLVWLSAKASKNGHCVSAREKDSRKTRPEGPEDKQESAAASPMKMGYD
jgi:hypothetical protein